MTPIGSRRSPLSFVVLALLAEQPMHAYGLHKLMQERRQDSLVNIERRNSVQQVLDRQRSVRRAIEHEQDTLAAADPVLPAVLLLENDLGLAQLRAELAWLELTTARLRGGELYWDQRELIAASQAGDHIES